jgi:hypothetical protein
MKLDDSAIAHIAKTLQVAILTGTDIVDNLRQIKFVVEDNSLFMDPEYKETFDMNIQKLLDGVQENTN